MSISLQSVRSVCWFVMGYDLNQDGGVDDQEEQTSKPDQQEGVVAFKLQEVCWSQPDTLIVERKYKSFFVPNYFIQNITEQVWLIFYFNFVNITIMLALTSGSCSPD